MNAMWRYLESKGSEEILWYRHALRSSEQLWKEKFFLKIKVIKNGH